MEDSTLSSNISQVSSTWSFYADNYSSVSKEKEVQPSKPNPNPNFLFKASSKNLGLGFSKKRGREALYDDSLEDTASSLLDGPKENSFGGEDLRKLEMGAADEKLVNNLKKGKYNCNALRKRGFCLVPLSMLIDYLDNYVA